MHVMNGGKATATKNVHFETKDIALNVLKMLNGMTFNVSALYPGLVMLVPNGLARVPIYAQNVAVPTVVIRA